MKPTAMLHASRCKLCNRRGATYAGWCPMCLVRGVRSMQAMSAPLMTFLIENHAVAPGDKMPYGDELLAKLRGTTHAPKEIGGPPPPLRLQDVVQPGQGTPQSPPENGDAAGPGGTPGGLRQ